MIETHNERVFKMTSSLNADSIIIKVGLNTQK